MNNSPLLISRAEADRILHLDKNTSYKLLPRTAFRGHVSWADVKGLMRTSARNGAEWDGGELADINEVNFGVPRKSVLRIIGGVPHFRLAKKTILVNPGLLDAIIHGEMAS